MRGVTVQISPPRNKKQTVSQIYNCHFYYCLGGSVKKGGGGGRVVDQVRRGVHGPGVSVFKIPLTDNSCGTKFKLHALRFLQHKKTIETERRLRTKQNLETKKER